ncbi:hypothetical protein H6503_03940 [Candidatus Woesearchaeota archaeon]|nr:hypothetical protein [Candidatus Woesearchaeota archaeon]
MVDLDTIVEVTKVSGVVGITVLDYMAIAAPVVYSAVGTVVAYMLGQENVMGLKNGKEGIRLFWDFMTRVDVKDLWSAERSGDWQEFDNKYQTLFNKYELKPNLI